MKIATFNINSIRARLESFCAWLRLNTLDIVLLQEIKCLKEQFPKFEMEMLGYHSVVLGQKSYNGVAILSKHPISDVRCGLASRTFSDTQSRYLEATICGMRIVNLYLPNGNPVGSKNFSYKLQWMKTLESVIRETLRVVEMPLVIGGDFNVIATDEDCFDLAKFADDAAMADQVRANYRRYLNLGLVDVFPALNPKDKRAYTFWDYQSRAWERDEGLRIDMFLTNCFATDLLQRCWVDRMLRGVARPSDHAPLLVEICNRPS